MISGLTTSVSDLDMIPNTEQIDISIGFELPIITNFGWDVLKHKGKDLYLNVDRALSGRFTAFHSDQRACGVLFLSLHAPEGYLAGLRRVLVQREH